MPDSKSGRTSSGIFATKAGLRGQAESDAKDERHDHAFALAEAVRDEVR